MQTRLRGTSLCSSATQWDVLDCDEWRKAVDECSDERKSTIVSSSVLTNSTSTGTANQNDSQEPKSVEQEKELMLCKTTFRQHAADCSAGRGVVLSYRWATPTSVRCGVREPGMQCLSSERLCVLPLNMFHALSRLPRGSLLWCDFLAHLHDPAHLPTVLNKMGSLYLDGVVWPLYLEKLARGDSDNASVMSALRRGWIQQEISFGRLHISVVEQFICACIEKK